MLVGLQSVPSDAASTTTTASNGAAASDPPTDVPVVAACRTSLPSTTTRSDQPRKIPIKPPRRKSSASAPRRPTVPPPKPLVVAPPKPVTITEVVAVLPPKPLVVAPTNKPVTITEVVLPPKPVLPAKPVLATAVPSEAAVSPSVSVSNETALPSRPLSTVSIVDIDEASGYATLNFLEGEPAEQQNGDNPAEEPIVESTTEETPQPPQTTEDTEAEQPGKMIANEAIYAKLNKKPGRKPPSRPQIKPRGPPPVPTPAVVEVEDDDVPPPLPTTRPPPEPESSPELPSKPVPKPRSRVSSSVKPAGAVEYNSAAVRVSFVDDVMETTDDDEAFQRRSNSSVVPHSTPPPPPPEDRRSPQPSIQPNEATVIESPAPTVDPSPKDKKSSKMGVLRSKSLRWTKGKFKNLKKDAPKSSSPGPDSPKPAAVITTPDENRRSVSRSVSTSAAPRKPPSPAHQVPSRPSRPLSQTAASPKPPSERRAPPPRPRPPVRPPPPKISSIDHVKIRSPTKVMERHREKVVDEKMRSYMAHQGYYVALCNHTDFSDLTFCTGDRIFVMYPIADDLVFGRNEDGEEGPFPLSCVRPEDDGGAAAAMMSMNENNQSNVNVSRASSYQPPSSSSSRWSSSSDGLQLNSAQEKCSPSHIRGQRRVPPSRPIRPPVPSTPEKTLISTEPPLQQETHLSSPHQHIGDGVEVSEKWDEEKVDAIPTNGSMGEEVQYSVEVAADTTTEDDMVTNDISHDLQAPTIVVPTTPTKSSSNISSAIVWKHVESTN